MSTNCVPEAALVDAIKLLRNDADPTTWVLAAHPDNDPNRLVLVSTGTGDVDELAAKLDDGLLMHAIARVTQKIDLSTTTKFVYASFLGSGVPIMKKAKFGTVSGQARQVFQPYHIDFDITSSNELSQQIVDRKIAETSGKINNVSEIIGDRQERGFTSSAGTKKSAAVKSSFGFQGNAPAASSSSAPAAAAAVQFDAALIEAIREVHHDDNAKWCLGVYEGDDLKKPVILKGKGSGSLDEMTDLLGPDSLAYGLIRVPDVIDNIKTIKFVYVFFLGPDVKTMTKAKVGTHKGAVQQKFAPFHVDLDISSVRELSDDIVQRKVSSNSGSRSNVL